MQPPSSPNQLSRLNHNLSALTKKSVSESFSGARESGSQNGMERSNRQSHCMPTTTALPQEMPTVKATDRPTLPQLIKFKTLSGGINITESIGLHYKQLGPLVLQDNDGTITETIERECFYKVKEINQEILQRWIQGKGMKPVQWSTLIDVLKKIELSPLAKKIADSLQ